MGLCGSDLALIWFRQTLYPWISDMCLLCQWDFLGKNTVVSCHRQWGDRFKLSKKFAHSCTYRKYYGGNLNQSNLTSEHSLLNVDLLLLFWGKEVTFKWSYTGKNQNKTKTVLCLFESLGAVLEGERGIVLSVFQTKKKLPMWNFWNHSVHLFAGPSKITIAVWCA